MGARYPKPGGLKECVHFFLGNQTAVLQVEGEEEAGLNCGTENCWAVNAKASQADIDAYREMMLVDVPAGM